MADKPVVRWRIGTENMPFGFPATHCAFIGGELVRMFPVDLPPSMEELESSLLRESRNRNG